MFEKTLQDLVKGIRSTKNDPSIYISQAIADIKNELKSTDSLIKSQAIRKLTYLHMLGYDMSWAAFHVVEVMSYDRFSQKRIGYIAACQSFNESTDVVLLCTNLLKKEFGSTNEYEVGLAINCLANIVTPDLARDLLGDVVAMMNSARPYVRKKAILVLYKIFLRYPQGLRLTFDHLKDRMEDPDVSVVSCAVNVICELANKKPQNYLRLAPNFFRLLTTSSNNWMLIKVVKLMASLVPEEPRLARKLLEPLATIIQNTPAKSLLYECINTVTTALLYTKKSDGAEPRNVPSVVKLCNDQLRQYIEDPDQNLKYLGLVGLGNLMRSHPYVLMEHQEVILECLGDDDITIRMRALDLVSGMVSAGNLIIIVRKLMHHAMSSDGHYRDELINRILDICGKDRYQNVEDFAWYIQVLVEMAHLQGARHGQIIAVQLIDIAVRVESVRAHAVRCMTPLLLDESALNAQGKGTMAEVLYAAVWITGEFSEAIEEMEDSDEEDEDEVDLPSYLQIADAMLQPRTAQLPGHVQAAYMQNLLKLVSAAANSSNSNAPIEECQAVASLIIDRIGAFMQSPHVEVQERACSLRQILISHGLGIEALPPNERAAAAFDSAEKDLASLDMPSILASYFEEPLGPVNPKAQRKVPVPEGIDFEKPFNREETRFLEAGPQDLPEDMNDGSFYPQNYYTSMDFAGEDEGYLRETHRESIESESDKISAETLERDYESQREKLRQDPFYLSIKSQDPIDINVDSIPMMHLNEDELRIQGDSKKKKGKKESHYSVNKEEIMPDGACSSEDETISRRKTKSKKNTTGLEDVDLITPLREDERIPDEHLFHRKTEEKKSKRSKKRSEEKEEKKKPKSHKEKSSRDREHKKSKDRGDDEKEKKKVKVKVKEESREEKKSKKSKSDKVGSSKSEKTKKKKEKKVSDKNSGDNSEPLLIF